MTPCLLGSWNVLRSHPRCLRGPISPTLWQPRLFTPSSQPSSQEFNEVNPTLRARYCDSFKSPPTWSENECFYVTARISSIIRSEEPSFPISVGRLGFLFCEFPLHILHPNPSYGPRDQSLSPFLVFGSVSSPLSRPDPSSSCHLNHFSSILVHIFLPDINEI